MKCLPALIYILIMIGIFAYGFKVGKMTAENEQKDKIAEHTTKTKQETEELKKQLSELREKLKERKNEECDFILSYPVAECLHD